MRLRAVRLSSAARDWRSSLTYFSLAAWDSAAPGIDAEIDAEMGPGAGAEAETEAETEVEAGAEAGAESETETEAAVGLALRRSARLKRSVSRVFCAR